MRRFLDDHHLSEFLRPLVAMAVLCLLGLAAGSAFWLHNSINRGHEAEFNRSVERIANEVRRRLHQPIFGLHGLRGMYASDANVTHRQFKAHVESLDLETEFSWVRGFGFIQHVRADEIRAFVEAEHAAFPQQFRFRRLEDKSYPDAYVSKYIEPYLPNLGAQGLDLGSEPRRREAVQLAVDSGRATLTRSITLVQSNGKTPGALLFVPVYRNAALVKDCVDSLLAHRWELGARRSRVILIDDSPGDDEVAELLATYESGIDDSRCMVVQKFRLLCYQLSTKFLKFYKKKFSCQILTKHRSP